MPTRGAVNKVKGERGKTRNGKTRPGNGPCFCDLGCYGDCAGIGRGRRCVGDEESAGVSVDGVGEDASLVGASDGIGEVVELFVGASAGAVLSTGGLMKDDNRH
jgi:hypothetical protein